MTITPKNFRVLEAAFEFGAAIALDFGVASGSVSIMAGIYFKLETIDDGHIDATLTGYFRLRGEVDVLGSSPHRSSCTSSSPTSPRRARPSAGPR